MDTNVALLFATIIAQLTIKKLCLEQSLYGILYNGIYGLLLGFEISKIYNFEIYKFFSLNKICLYILLFTFYKYNKKIYDYLNALLFGEYVYMKTYLYSEYKIFEKYINYFPEFYDEVKKNNNGNHKILSIDLPFSNGNIFKLYNHLGELKKPIDNYKVYFNDTNFNVKGYYVWSSEETILNKINNNKLRDEDVENNKIKLDYPCLTIYIQKNSNMTVNKYFENIKEKINKILETFIELNHHKVLLSGDMSVKYDSLCLYKGGKKSIEELEELYIKPFFHKKKKQLWKLIKEIHYDPDKFIKLGQPPRIGLLLYGPPGTGKSSFCYRIAMSLNRSIISIDLRIIKSKREIYRIFRRPRCHSVEEKETCDNVIFVFDEFDIAIKELYAKKHRANKFREQWLHNIMTIYGSDKNVINEKQESSIKTKNDNENNNDNKNKNNKNNIDIYGFDPDELTLEDLLELFQGPVPLNGSIIIATSNNYEEMNEICPALFRPGRLTPIYFGYADNNMIKDMCKFYYDKEFEIKEDISKFKITPSYLMHIACESKITIDTDPYEYFINKLKEKLI
jgi:hypothetical protein